MFCIFVMISWKWNHFMEEFNGNTLLLKVPCTWSQSMKRTGWYRLGSIILIDYLIGHYLRRKMLKNIIQLCTFWAIRTSGQEDILISTLVAWKMGILNSSLLHRYCQTKSLLILLPINALHLLMNISVNFNYIV